MTSQPKFNIVMRLNKEFLNEYKDLSGIISSTLYSRYQEKIERMKYFQFVSIKTSEYAINDLV